MDILGINPWLFCGLALVVYGFGTHWNWQRHGDKKSKQKSIGTTLILAVTLAAIIVVGQKS